MSDTTPPPNTENAVLLDQISISTMVINGHEAFAVQMTPDVGLLTALGMLDAARMYLYQNSGVDFFRPEEQS